MNNKAYGYLAQSEGEELVSTLQAYAVDNNLDLKEIIQQQDAHKLHWRKRSLAALIEEELGAGDHVVVFESSDLARSTLQVLELLELASSKGISVHLIRYGEIFVADNLYQTEDFIRLIKLVENEYVTKRTTDALARRRDAGLPLGRPKGRKNKSRKLDKYKTEIKRYLNLGVNKASIAKLVGCHAQTLYNYLEDNNLLEKEQQDKLKA